MHTIVRFGIDIGALYLKMVRLDESDRICDQVYLAHKGDPGKALENALARLQVRDDAAVGMTGSAAGLFADTLGVPLLDITRCQILAARRHLPQAMYIIDIGGASATLIQLDSDGKFLNHATNSMCAAGTGSFLDEQAARMNISVGDAAAFEHVSDPPTIATRCSVFAKSDLIHRQQEGYNQQAMWSGLCRGMTRTLLATLLNGRPLDGPAAVIGGVAQNAEVLRWLRQTYPEFILVPETPHMTAAAGAALLASPLNQPVPRSIPLSQTHVDREGQHSWPLSMEKSRYPSFDAAERFVDADDNEVRILHWPDVSRVSGVLGIDIGSTSTKAALVDEDNRVLVDIYRKTSGNPLHATQLLFKALRNLAETRKVTLDIQAVGTTGSGRKMVGQVIGADAIINEISAHVAGAVETDPTIDTIFEIGGQDSKYMHVVDGHIRDANMNYVCAAGTGSFVEEQAHKLGYPVDRVGPAVLGLNPPRASDRCTVFMEQDVAKLVQSGTSPEQALAGVMVSVVKNYLNKVVGNRYRSREKIFFQGATARNPALVAAFERLLDVQMVVSPYCHVMGAFGVALLTRQAMRERGAERSSFRGLDLDQRKIEIRYDTCRLCQNDCKITFAHIEGLEQTPSWGYMCGRDPEESRVRVNRHDRALRRRERLWREAGHGVPVSEDAPVVGIPQALTTYTYLPLWRRFFNRLGYQVQLSGPTTEQMREIGTRITGAEFCFPAKVALGHVADLASRHGVDYVFIPHMVSEEPNPHTNASKFCPYVQAVPSYARTALELNGISVSNLLSPVIDLRLPENQLLDYLVQTLSKPLRIGRKAIRQAWRDGVASQREFERRCREEGRKIMDEAASKDEKLLVLLGRPYNNHDMGLNLDLPRKLAEQGRTVLPLDFLAPDLARLGDRYRNIFWAYGQKILAACEQVAVEPKMDAVYLTNFNCGPDSFLLTFAEETLGSRPFLALELDEHGADAGYMTRIEAYFDVLRRPRSATSTRIPFKAEPDQLKDRIIWLPPMHPLATPFFAAAFRGHGYDGRPLPLENRRSFEIGRSMTRGTECLPTALTLGTFVTAMEATKEPARRHALFMPTAEGPCRFGQYCTLHRQALDRAGLSDAAIMAPSSFNSYQGIEESLRRWLWPAMLAADILYKAACKVRPYERHAGETNRVLAEQQKMVEEVLERQGDIFNAVWRAVERISSVSRHGRPKPLVGVVGEIYVRCNPFANEDVIGAIERFGGEAWLAPASEWVLYTAATQNLSFRDRNRNPMLRWLSDLKNLYLFAQERRMYEAAGRFLDDRHEPDVRAVLRTGQRYLPVNFEGESILTLGRAIHFAEQGASMVVNCAPFGCMPGTLTTAMFRQIAADMQIPVVSLFYDGSGDQNARLEVFLNNAIEQHRPPAQPATPARERRPRIDELERRPELNA